MKGAKKLTEAAFTRDILSLARLTGWRSAHFRPARTATGWRTPVAGDGKGFLDLVLLHPRRRLFLVRELKVGGGRPTPEQGEWLLAWQAVGADAGVWRDTDWAEIERTLKGETDA